MKIINLSVATILSISLASPAIARESFYRHHKNEPSISINLGALANLQPAAPEYNGRATSGFLGAPGATMVTAHPVIDPQPIKAAKPHKAKQVAKAKPVPKPKPVIEEESIEAEVETAPTPTLPPIVEPILTLEDKPAPAPTAPTKPSINLPEMAASDIKTKPPVTQPAPAPAPTIVASIDNNSPLLSDAPAPAIIPEAAKTTPNLPAKDAMALHKPDNKVVTLPATTVASLPDMPPPPPPLPAAKPLSKPVAEKPVAEKPTPKKPVPSPDDNIATLLPEVVDIPTPAPAPTPKPEVKKAPALKSVASIPDQSLEIPTKPSASPIMDDSLTIRPREVKAAAAASVPAPTPAAKPALPPIAASSENPLEKPTVKELPPLSDLFDKKETNSGTPPAPAPTQVAQAPSMPTKESIVVQPQTSVQPTATPAPSGATLSMVYGEAEVELPLAEKPNLDGIISQLTANKDMHVAVIAYASGTPDQASQAKRTALARALAVRTYLLDHNISADRMDIKPLGNKSGSGVPDRVDIVLQKTSQS